MDNLTEIRVNQATFLTTSHASRALFSGFHNMKNIVIFKPPWQKSVSNSIWAYYIEVGYWSLPPYQGCSEDYYFTWKRDIMSYLVLVV